MSFLRHIGKIGDRKVVVVFREVPNEPHMALVVYSETLNAHIHDPMMKVIESDIGQNSETLGEALNRNHTRDGKNLLQTLHGEGLLKKVQSSQVLMTPAPGTQIRLDELNTLLDEMKQGESAIKRLAEMDESRGIQSGADIARRMRESAQPKVAGSADVLGDSTLAAQRMAQAVKMENEAKGLLAEAARLTEEAKELDPSLGAAPEPKKRGRPAKAKTIK